jgi:hypothetical protein
VRIFKFWGINIIFLLTTSLALLGCDKQLHFNIKGRDGNVAVSVPKSMLSKRSETPGANVSMILLNLYPDDAPRYLGDVLMLETFRDNTRSVSYEISTLKAEDKADSPYPSFNKFYRDSGFALIQNQKAGDISYLECAEAINQNTKCWYFGEFEGFLSYKLAIPLNDVENLDSHIKGAEDKIKSFVRR